MDDQSIIDLYWKRDQEAVRETERQYGRYCHTISLRILRVPEDADECVNDTWLRAWQAMPPERPRRLAVWLGRITRNLSLNRLEANQAGKRGGGEVTFSFEELEQSIGAVEGKHPLQKGVRVESALDRIEARELAVEISAFLLSLPRKKRMAFVGRYYYFATLDEIAETTGLSKRHLSVILYRIRQNLMIHLQERGYT